MRASARNRPENRPWIRRCRRILGKAAILGITTALLVELALRWLLFAPPAALAAAALPLRRAELFANEWEQDYWKLRYVFRDPERVRMPRRHALLGWYAPDVDPKTYDHVKHARLAGRRPILFYGDSFTACVTPPEECWQGLLDASPLAADFTLLNYGVGGYGLDQTYLLARESLALYAQERPLVVIGILIDDDMDRIRLRMRGWPKPYLVPAADGSLVLDEPVAADETEFLAHHPLALFSYAWRYLLCGSGLVPSAIENRWTRRGPALTTTRERATLVLDALAETLRAQDVEYFFLLFHGPSAQAPSGTLPHGGWRETFLVSELQRLNLPYVLSSVELAHSNAGALYFDDGSVRRSHYTPEGNRVVFGALVRGIEGRFETTDG